MCAAILLSPRQEAFCRFVARGHKLTTAASVAGYSPRSARQRGSELWHKPEIQRRIAEPRAEREATRAAHIALSCQQLDLIFDSALRNKREGVALKTEAMRLMILDLVDAEGPTDTPGRLLPDSRANQDDDPIDTGAADANGSPPDLEPDPAPSPAPLPTTLGVLPPPPPPPAPLLPEGVDPDNPERCILPRGTLAFFEQTPEEFLENWEQWDRSDIDRVRDTANLMAEHEFYPDLDLLGTPEVVARLREEEGPWHTMPRDARPPVWEDWPRTVYTDRFKQPKPVQTMTDHDSGRDFGATGTEIRSEALLSRPSNPAAMGAKREAPREIP